MDDDRRTFLKVAGAAALGTAGMAFAGQRVARAEPHEIDAAVESGTRWALAIDVRRCVEQGDCTRCFDACHRAHNVPNFVDNPWLGDEVATPVFGAIRGNNRRHEIKWIWRAGYHNAFPMQASRFMEASLPGHGVPVLCNHCDNPPCVRVCPTQATWRREDGIVMMDMHRCIGCRFCVVGCPYGSRSFNLRDPRDAFRRDPTDPERVVLPSPDYPTRMRGVVEKCDFCAELDGEEDRTPHCVRACTAGALTFGDLSDGSSEVRRLVLQRFTIRRKPSLGTEPHVFYIV